MASKTIDVDQAQVRLKDLVHRASLGEEIVLSEKGSPIAKLIPVTHVRAQREFGSARGLIHIHDDFEAPLEDFSAYG